MMSGTKQKTIKLIQNFCTWMSHIALRKLRLVILLKMITETKTLIRNAY